MAGIEIRALTKAYPGGVTAVDELDLTIADGELFASLGPSGCSKTTLLRTIAGLERATSGTLLVGGRDVTTEAPGKRDVAMVFQDYALFPHMSVTDNIAYPLRIQKMPLAERRAKAHETAEGLGLAELMDRRPGQLSGGSSSGSHSPGPSPTARRSSCSTSRCRTWTPACDWRRARSSSACSASWGSPPCSSPTTRPRRWRWPTGLR